MLALGVLVQFPYRAGVREVVTCKIQRINNIQKVVISGVRTYSVRNRRDRL
jgi:hypothetical protein